MTTRADKIRTYDTRSYNAWAAQRACYGLSLDDDAFADWHEALEAQERDRMTAILAR